MSLGSRIKALREQSQLSQKEFAAKMNIANNTLSMYENDLRVPNDTIKSKIADYFGVTIDYLLGRAPIETGGDIVQIPVLGSIPAGTPLEAIEDIVDWEDIPKAMCSGGKEFFSLKVKGDSMWPDFLEGDIVILRKTPSCETGDVCAVLVNGDEATLKTVKLAEDGALTITPKNPSYPPRTFTPEQIRQLPVSIAGVVVELRRKIK